MNPRASYHGKDYDASTGSYDFVARWYRSDRGRFSAQDPFVSRFAQLTQGQLESAVPIQLGSSGSRASSLVPVLQTELLPYQLSGTAANVVVPHDYIFAWNNPVRNTDRGGMIGAGQAAVAVMILGIVYIIVFEPGKDVKEQTDMLEQKVKEEMERRRKREKPMGCKGPGSGGHGGEE